MAALAPILVGTDFSQPGDAAVFAAVEIARRTGASIDVFHAVDRPDGGSLVPRARERLEKLADLPGARVHVEQGDVGEVLAELRAKLQPGLVVLGAIGRHEMRRRLFGGMAERAVRTPGCPLLVVREAPRGGLFKQILVGVEDPDRASAPLATALALAHESRGEVTVLHVLPPRGYASDRRRVELSPETVPARLERLVVRLDATIPVATETRRGDPGREICRLAEEQGSHLVVLGAERGARGGPGPVCEHVAAADLPAVLYVWPREDD